MIKCRRETPLKHDKMQAQVSLQMAIRMKEATSISTHSINMKILILSMRIGDIVQSILSPLSTKKRKKLIMDKNMHLHLEFYMKQFREKIFA